MGEGQSDPALIGDDGSSPASDGIPADDISAARRNSVGWKPRAPRIHLVACRPAAAPVRRSAHTPHILLVDGALCRKPTL
jgi:hypothetical protein